jgi:hypothetical protein
MAWEGRRSNTPCIPVIPFFFLFSLLLFFLSLFSGAGKEARRELQIVWEDVRVCKGDRLLL